jgi:kynurenine formamidase
MARRFIDLSIAIRGDVISDPPGLGPQIEYSSHRDNAPAVALRYPDLQPEDLVNGEGFAAEMLHVLAHNGTHVDAPWHYASTTSDGAPMASIDEIPLEWFFGPGVKLDFRHLADGYVAQARDVEAELQRIGHELRPGEIVLVNTSAAQRYGQPDYYKAGCGMGREATLHLTSRGVRVAGTDAWGWDVYHGYTAQMFSRTRDVSLIWEGHKAGREIPYCHMEKLINLETLPPDGFEVICFPVKIHRGSAGWTRAVALMDA